MKEKVIEYHSCSEDVVVNSGQNYRLPGDYCWIREEKGFQIRSAVLYRIALAIGAVYCRCFLHVSIRNRSCLRKAVSGQQGRTGQGIKKQKGKKDTAGIFIYANHTQPVGDVFLPALVCFPRRIYTVVSPSNLGLPLIGRLLPALGALPVPDDKNQMREFLTAVDQRAKEGNAVIIYPEAHVWPYYTKIRPYTQVSFRFPVRAGAPVFAMTSTYRKRKWRQKPAQVVYLDGPFFPDPELQPKEQQKKLFEEVKACMEERSKSSSCRYICYRKKEE